MDRNLNQLSQNNTIRLVISCPDAIGLVASVSQFIADHNGSILESSQHTDVAEKWFFMRNEINTAEMTINEDEFIALFKPIAEKYQMQWFVRNATEKQKVALFVSQSSHCLADILHRWHTNELSCEISCIVSNHENLKSMAEWYEVPFHHVPIPTQNKADAFAEIERALEQYTIDTIILARYMQIIPTSLCQKYNGRLINIHHSFLPSFIGANPYQKAFDRGVKLIGATCHYVTEDLDEGPIIEQDVIRVSHSCSKSDLVRLGKDVETAVLSRGVRYHLEDRVIIRGNKTVVF